MNPIFLDIETAPCLRADVRDYLAAKIELPGNISKAETIAAWNAEKRPLAVAEAVTKTSLDGAFGSVVCIGYDFRDGDTPGTIYGLDERKLLEDFNVTIEENVLQSDLFSSTIVGHNVAAFDLRFLVQRYIVNGLKPHPLIARAAQAKPWESEKVYDTMVQWAGVGNRVGMKKLCLALGIPDTDEVDGNMVAGLVAAGKLADVAAHCVADVIKTREVYRRMVFA